MAPLSPRRYEIRVTVDEETHGKLRQLQDLMAHSRLRDPAAIVARGIDALLKETLAKKAGIVAKPRAAKRPEKRTRNIPAAVERAVWTRDGGRCAFVDGNGRRCAATAFVEFHHVNNWARGAEHDPAEIELRCRAHNQYQAVLDYGAELIAARRRSRPSRARERGRRSSAGGQWPVRRMAGALAGGPPARPAAASRARTRIWTVSTSRMATDSLRPALREVAMRYSPRG